MSIGQGAWAGCKTVQGMTLATGPLARRRFSAVGPVRATSRHFGLARMGQWQQFGPLVGLVNTGPTQTKDSQQFIDGFLS